MKPKNNLTLTPGNAGAVTQYAELIGITPLTVYCRIGGGERLAFELRSTYGQLSAIDWSNSEAIRNDLCRSGTSTQPAASSS